MNRIWAMLLTVGFMVLSPGYAADTNTDTQTTQNNEIIDATSIALRGKPFYPPDFTHFNYTQPNAPQGGKIVDWVRGTFDNFNPYATRGDASLGSRSLYDDLMASSDDDLSAYYPLIAKKISYVRDYSWVIFHIDERARFQDGESIKPSDVKFSFNKLTQEGLPGLKAYYNFVENIEVLDKTRVKFTLNDEKKNRSRMLALCGLPVFPEHFWKNHRLDEPLKAVPVGSSAYTISDYELGKYEVVSQIKDYWAKELPVMKGLLNEEATQYDYYRDETVAFEAFKAGKIDKWTENTAKRWANGYVFPALKDGRVLKLEVEHEIPLRAQGFIFNVKRPIFQDVRVRKALTYLMDFEWMNKNLFYSQYKRVNSYFMNTPYQAKDLPSEAELEFLSPIRDKIPESVFTEAFVLPKTDGKGNIRKNLRLALKLFKEAGWVVKKQKLINAKTNKPFEFELLLVSPSMEKIALAFNKNLKKAGITMHIRTVDSSQYAERSVKHDYDMISRSFRANPYPSSGTRQQWHSESLNSSYNHANVEDEAIDYLMDEILDHQEDDEKLLALGHTIDRVLLHSYYMIPQWSISKFRIAHWDKFGKPTATPKYSLGDDAWWVDQKKAVALQ